MKLIKANNKINNLVEYIKFFKNKVKYYEENIKEWKDSIEESKVVVANYKVLNNRYQVVIENLVDIMKDSNKYFTESVGFHEDYKKL